MKLVFSIIIFLSALSFNIGFVNAQTAYSSESDLKKHAAELFEEEQYAEALPLYSQLLSLYNKDPNYNYRFAVCLLLGTEDKEKPLQFLEFAARNPDTEKEVFFFLGKAYQLNYRFFDAQKAYEKYKALASGKQNKKLDVDRAIETCNNGKFLLNKPTDLKVLEKKEIRSTDFFRAYNLSDLPGKLVVKPEDFMTVIDKKKKAESVMYFAPGDKAVYFSSYGESDKNSKDLYKAVKLPSGEFGKPINLGAIVNTAYDEDYPFMHPDGKTLYFASKGHNSMGGYDIFRTIYSEATNTWTKPENLDFPLNSPDDDIMFVTDAESKVAYFASKRTATQGNTNTYKVGVELKPQIVMIIKGTFKWPDNAAVPTKITVKKTDAEGRVEGVFKVSEKGDYLLSIPNGGQFQFIVEADSYKKQTEIVEVPALQEFKLLKQQIELKNEAGAIKMYINNNFDDIISSEEQVVAVFKEKGRLEVNYDENAINNSKETTAVNKSNPVTENKTNENNAAKNTGEPIKMAYDEAKQTETEAEKIKEEFQKAYAVANDKNELAKKQYEEGQAIITSANNLPDGSEKEEQTKKGNTLLNDAAVNYEKASLAYNLAKNLEDDHSKKKQQAEVELQYAKQLDTYTKTGQGNDVLEKLEDEKDKLESENNNSTGITAESTQSKEKAEIKQKELANTEAQSADLKKELEDIATEQDNLKTQVNKTKDKQLKETFNNQIADLETEKTDKTTRIAELDKKSAQLKQEVVIANTQANLVSDLVNEISSAPIATTSVDKYQLKANLETNKNIKSDAVVYNEQSSVNQQTTNNDQSAGSKQNADPAITSSEIGALNNQLPSSFRNNEPYVSADNDVERALKITDEKERNVTLAKIYKELGFVITDQVNAEKEKLLVTTDAAAKAEIQSNIDKLTAVQALNAENYKAAQAKVDLAATAIANNEQPKTNTEESTVSNESTANESVQAVEKKYQDELSTIDEFVEAGDKPKAILDLNNKYIATIDQEIAKNKSEVQKSRSEAEKARAEDAIAKLEKKKQDLILQNDNLKKSGVKEDANVVVSNNQQQNEQPVNNSTEATNEQPANNNATAKITEIKQKYNKANFAYNQEMSDINAIPNIEARQKAKIQSDEKLVAELETIVNEYKAVFNSATLDQQKDITQEIKLYQSIEKEKNDEITSLKASLDATAANKVNNNQSQATNEQSVNNQQQNTSPSVTSINGVANDLLPENYEAKINYTNSKVRSALVDVKQMAKDKAALDTRADEVFQNSNNFVGEAKSKMIIESDSLREESAKKQMELNNKFGEANRIEFEGNKNSIDQYLAANNGNGSDDATIAALQAEDANTLFAQAKAARTLAQNANDNITKRDAQERAFNLEQMAIEKQQKALASFKSINPNKNITAVNSEQSTANNNTPVNEQAVSNQQQSNTTEQPATNNIKTFTDYKSYADLKNEAALNLNNSFEQTQKEERLGKEAEEYKALATFTRQKATAAENDADKQKYNRSADSLQVISDGKRSAAVEAGGLAENYKTTAAQKNNEAEQFVQALDKASYEKINNTYTSENKENAAILSNLKPAAINSQETALNRKENTTNQQAIPKEEQNATLNRKENVENQQPIPVEEQNATLNRKENVANQQPIENTTDENQKVASANQQESNNNTTVNKNNQESAANNQAPTNTTAPKNLREVDEFFEKTSTPVYSTKNPIPINPELPSGLLFKVQVGAFRNPIPQDLFKGFNPLTGETTPSGLTRYSAGIFKTFKNADQAKNEIRGFGYNDAFVVAYFNGKRISFAEAMAMLNKNQPLDNNTQTNTELKDFVRNQPAANNQQLNTQAVNTADFTNLNSMTGLAYTIQVGVYSKPVSAEKLFNIQPLYVENTDNGFMRYTSGIYNSLTTAVNAKNAVVEIGIKDAFVVAYKDGKRISMADAKQLEASQGAAAFVKSPDLNKMPYRENGNAAVQQSGNNNPPKTNNQQPENPQAVIPAGNNNDKPASVNQTGIVYKIQIGAFREEVPNDIAAIFFKISSKGVEHYVAENNLTIYTVGALSDYNAAEQLKNSVIAEGLKDAFVVAYENGKKMDLEAAKKITNP